MTNPDPILSVGDGRLLANSRLYRPDPELDRAADLFDSDPQAWLRLPVHLQDLSGLQRDARAQYLAAVAAGLIPDDRTGSAA